MTFLDGAKITEDATNVWISDRNRP